MTRNTARVARRSHRCRCGHSIVPGELYVSSVASPNHGEIGNVGWWREAECSSCAERYGRGWLLDARYFGLRDLVQEVRA